MNDRIRPLPSSFQPKTILTSTDLDNHPLAEEYIAHLNRQKYPMDFQQWLKWRERKDEKHKTRQQRLLQQAIDDPFCRSPIKRRVIR